MCKQATKANLVGFDRYSTFLMSREGAKAKYKGATNFASLRFFAALREILCGKSATGFV
jgi:hypothetical protein